MGSKAKLRVEVGVGRGREYELEENKPFYMGRDRKCDYYIPTGRASRVHCKVEGAIGSFGVFDLDSRNGTYVNGERVESRVLRPGDAIEVAGNRLIFELGEVQPVQLQRMGGKLEAAATADGAPPKDDAIVVAPRPKPKAPAQASDFGSELGDIEYADAEKALANVNLGDVKLLAPIGKGQRCVIFKGTEASKNRLVAIKMLNAATEGDADLRRWFVQGAKRAAELRHENTVRIIRGGREGERLYLVMEHMERSAFNRFHMAETAGLALVKSSLQTIVNVSRALEFGLKEHGQLHGGVRPSKILYDEKRRGMLSGLGFEHGLNAPGVLAGERIIAYFAPELVAKLGEASVRTDIYSLGATFYYMTTGRQPVRDGRGILGDPRKFNSAVPDSLVRILETMTAPKPEDRYESYAHLLHDLRWALRGESWHHT
jgi:hypothetical protein